MNVMLVLSRKAQESLVIVDPYNDDSLIKITVVEIRGHRIRLGIEAADHVPIWRSELWEQTQTEAPQTNNNVSQGNVVRSEVAEISNNSSKE